MCGAKSCLKGSARQSASLRVLTDVGAMGAERERSDHKAQGIFRNKLINLTQDERRRSRIRCIHKSIY